MAAHDTEITNPPTIIAVGGGKGGTGKSTVALNIATCLALSNNKVVLADLDFGGANLHTMIGLQINMGSIADFIYNAERIYKLGDLVVWTRVQNLGLLGCSGFVPGIANMKYAKKQKLMRSLRKLKADYIICDLGAGSSYNVIDFFLLASKGILVLTPEAISILNAYEFIKNCIFRKILRCLSQKPTIVKLINQYKIPNRKPATIHDIVNKVRNISKDAASTIEKLCSNFRPAMLFNMASSENKSLGYKLNILSRKYLNISVDYLGNLPYEPRFHKQEESLFPFPYLYPQSQYSFKIKKITKMILKETNKKITEEG